MSTEGESKFYDLHEDTIEMIETVISKMALPFNLKIKYLGNSKQKCLVKLQKLNDVVVYMTNVDLIVYINEDYLIKFDDEISEILLFQELDRLEFDINKGTFKIGKFQLQTNPGVLKKYGIDAVAEANQLVELYTQQKADGADETFDVKTLSTTKVTKDVEFLN